MLRLVLRRAQGLNLVPGHRGVGVGDRLRPLGRRLQNELVDLGDRGNPARIRQERAVEGAEVVEPECWRREGTPTSGSCRSRSCIVIRCGVVTSAGSLTVTMTAGSASVSQT